MKRRYGLFSLALLFLCATASFAQTEEGSAVIMGNLSFSSASGDAYGEDTRTQFQVGPRGYYFLIRNLGVGGRIMFSSASQGDVSSSNLRIGPDGAYFFGGSEGSTATVIPTVGAGIYFIRSTTDNGISEGSDTGVSFGLHGGLAIMLGPYLALLPEIEFDIENLDGNPGNTLLMSIALAGFIY